MQLFKISTTGQASALIFSVNSCLVNGKGEEVFPRSRWPALYNSTYSIVVPKKRCKW